MTEEQALGRAIAVVRTGRGLLQKILARRAGYDLSYISLIESGHRTPSLPCLKKIAEILEIQIGRLLEIAAELREGKWE